MMSYVDCGHGLAFIKRHDGRVEELHPRGLPLGVSSEEKYQEGGCVFDKGDALVLYSDGVIDSQPELNIDNEALAARLAGAASAKEMVDRIAAIVPAGTPLPDDLTVLVVYKKP